MSVGDRIKIIRGDLERKEFARKIGVHRNMLAIWENDRGMPGGDSLLRIYKQCGANINWVLSGEGKPFIKDSIRLSEDESTIGEANDFIRRVTVFPKNNFEIYIKEGYDFRPKSYSHSELGFLRHKFKNWNTFLSILEKYPHIYDAGKTSQQDHKKLKSRLFIINSKLVSFFGRQFSIPMPQRYLIYERYPELGTGVFKFKFQIGIRLDF